MRKEFQIDGKNYALWFFRNASNELHEKTGKRIFIGETSKANQNIDVPDGLKAEILANFNVWNYVAVYVL